MDRLTSMSVFVKVAELGSFAAAAGASRISSPMVGKHIRFLEDHLRARLINRTTRRHSLTEIGRAYYERCKRALAEVQAADAVAAEQSGEPVGRLRVSMPLLFGRRCAAPILLDLARSHPRLELTMSFNDRPIDLLDGEFDLALRNGPPPDTVDVMARRVFRQEMIVCAAPAYLAARGAPLRIEDLAGHDAIAYTRSGRPKPWVFPVTGAAPIEAMPRPRLRLDDLEAIADAAVAGFGLAWLPCWLIRDRVAAGALRAVLTDRQGMVLDSHALWVRTPHMPQRLRVAIDALASRLPVVTQAMLSAGR